MGLFERDPLKQFLYFFLFIERYTHRTFARLLQQDPQNQFFNVPSRLGAVGAEFSAELLVSAKSLKARFMWCALLAWSALSEADVATFAKLKRERDRISHGKRTQVRRSLAAEARALSVKLVLCDLPPP